MESVSSRLPCCLLKRRLKWDFLDIYPFTLFGARKLKNTSAMRVNFFWKCLKLNLNLENAKKKFRNCFWLWDNFILKCCYKFSLIRSEYLLSALNASRNSPKILDISQRDFKPQLYSQRSINMVKDVSFRFENCFGPFTVLLVEGSSETGLFRNLSNHVF